MNDKEDRQLGIQPLDSILEENAWANSDLVAVSTEQLTHKQVQKSRKGRRVSANIQHKVLNSLNQIQKERETGKRYVLNELFNYDA